MTAATLGATDSRPANAPGLRPSVRFPRLKPVPLVSVLVSNYNYGHLAAESIESVLAQSHTHFELILCDDGSTDDSLAVFHAFERRDPRVRVIAKKNGGQATGFNAAYRESSGEVICLLDTDDIFYSNKLARVVEAFRCSPDAGCAVNRLMRVDANRRPGGRLPLLAKLPSGWHGSRLLRTGGVLSDMPGTPGLSFRRQVFEAMFPLPEEKPINVCPDMVMLRLAPLLTPIVAIEDELAEMRLHGHNTYTRPKLTAASIRRELDICESLWRVQRNVLDRIHPAFAKVFAALEGDRTIVLQKYILARFEGDRSALGYHRQLMKLPWPDRQYARWFWFFSLLIPSPLFKRGVNAFMTQNRWKQRISQFANLFSLSHH